MIKPLSQTDPRWANKKLGTGTIKDRGCTVTCCAMLAQTTPDKIVDEADFTDTGAILWQSLKSLKFIWRGYFYENDKVSQAIKDYGGCLVEVSMPQAPGGKHWVLFIGGGQMNNPLTGKTEATSKYDPTGYCILEPLETTNNNMQELLNKYSVKTIEELDKKIFEHLGLDWGNAENVNNKSHLASDRRKIIKLENEAIARENKITNLEGQVAVLKMEKAKVAQDLKDANARRVLVEGELKEAQDEIKRLNELIKSDTKDLEKIIAEREKQISELEGEVKRLENTKINQSELVSKFLEQVIQGLGNYGGEKTLEGVLNSISQREAQREELKKRVAELEANPLIKIIQALKDLIR